MYGVSTTPVHRSEPATVVLPPSAGGRRRMLECAAPRIEHRAPRHAEVELRDRCFLRGEECEVPARRRDISRSAAVLDQSPIVGTHRGEHDAQV